MGGLQDFLILFTLLLEIAVLFYIEKKAWQTYYTPLNFLMFPYTIVLLITIIVAGGESGFVSFYYPSIIVWNVGLLIFAIPSFTIAFISYKINRSVNSELKTYSLSNIFKYLSILLCLIFFIRLVVMMKGSGLVLGTSEFGKVFCGRGLWGHLRVVTIPLLILSIFLVDKKNKLLHIFIIVFLIVGMLYNIKGWVIIPVISAMSMRLYYGKTKLNLQLITFVIAMGFLVFLSSYVLSILVVQSKEMSSGFMDFIYGHFFHYLTSGTLGWSMDLQLGIIDNYSGFHNIIAQIVNLGNLLTGETEMITAINPLFFNSGISFTNVRTFFGTLYINSSIITFVLYTLTLSAIMYVIKLSMDYSKNIYISIIYFFYCGLLFMGWFDFLFANLNVYEIPFIIIAIRLFERIATKRVDVA